MNRSQHPASYKQIQILFFALLAGQVMIGAVIYFLLITGEFAPKTGENMFNYIVPVVVLGSVAASVFINRHVGQRAGEQAGLQEKLLHYRTRNILRWAVLQGGNMIALVLAALEGDTLLLFWFAFGVMAFAVMRPSLDKFREEYQLTNTERQELEQNP